MARITIPKVNRKRRAVRLTVALVAVVGLLCAALFQGATDNVVPNLILIENDEPQQQPKNASNVQPQSHAITDQKPKQLTTTTTTDKYGNQKYFEKQPYLKFTGYKPVSTALDVKMTKEDEAYEKDPGIKYVVGLMFTDKPKYLDAIEAEQETWMKPIPDRRIFLVGSDPPKRENLPRFVKSPCPDNEVWCKRVEHIAEGYRMLTEDKVEFDWLLSGNEDWYVNIPIVNVYLEKRDPKKEAVIFTGIGCAQWWKYHKNSNNGTKPKPAGFWDIKSCETLKRRGGVCGGTGIVFSRRSIEIMGEGGHDNLFQRTRNEPFRWDTRPYGDPVLSCLVYSYNDLIKFESLPWSFATGLARGKHSAMVHARVGFDGADKKLGLSPAGVLRKSHEIITGQKA